MSQSGMNRRRIFALLVGLAAIAAAYLLRDLVREFVLTPILYLAWVTSIFYRLLPQGVYWAVLLFLFVTLAFGSLSSRDATEPESLLTKREHLTRLETWALWLRYGDQGSYSRWRLANQLARLALEVLAQQEQISPDEAKEAIRNGSQEMPPAIRAYLLAGLSRQQYRTYNNLLERLLHQKPNPALTLPPEEVLNYLERRLDA